MSHASAADHHDVAGVHSRGGAAGACFRAGAGSKHAIGTGVIGGMISAAVLAIFWIPLFYVMICTIFDRTKPANEGVKEDSL